MTALAPSIGLHETAFLLCSLGRCQPDLSGTDLSKRCSLSSDDDDLTGQTSESGKSRETLSSRIVVVTRNC